MQLTRTRTGASFPVAPRHQRRQGAERDAAESDADQPIAAELFSIERLEQHARTLAAAQRVRPGSNRGFAIRRRVADNGRVLVESYRVLAQAIKEERTITPAAEWLVDNFSVVDEQLREIRDDLPPDYYKELPKLAGGHLEGYPRVLGLAWAYVAHTDSRFDPESLRRMVRAYQEVEPLTIGELWAIAISLRILYVENLRRLAERIIRSRADRQAADDIADRLLGLVDDDSSNAASPRLSLAQLSTAGRVQLFQRFRDQDPAVTTALHELERLLTAQGTGAEELVQLEHQRMATMNVTVRNVITSMRLISWFDWAEFVESVGLVDGVLRSRSRFAEMDFATRNRYRNAVEQLARRSQRTEVAVAERAAEMAEDASRLDAGDPAGRERARDPGFYLIAGGRAALERDLGARVPMTERIDRRLKRAGGALYVGLLVVLSAFVIGLWLLLSGDRGWGLLVALLAIGPASRLAVTIVNHTVTRSLGPLPLPRLDLDDGVPEGMRTLVVVPILLTSAADVDAQVAGLEVHYLSNRDGDLRFALLSDWLDAEAESVEGDDDLLAAAASGIDRLNERYGDAPGGGARFLLFHRTRRWNPSEQCWMGWERKRGKLEELNALLRGSTTTTFLTNTGPRSLPPTGVRYVVTLDADTRLTRGVIGRLVGTLAHPLNLPTFDARLGRVTDGYGLLQPRITPTLPERDDASWFQKIFARSAGIDPYATAVSDLYQDLFEEGSFTGKGIYDVDAFASAMRDRVPENALLSHDLFEGVFARAGLVTDIELFDEYPSDYLEAAARSHRWARGDWQLLPWIAGRRRDDGHDRAWRHIGGVGRWKMLDNLRRTLAAPLDLATLIAAWTIAPASAMWWTALVLVSIVVPPALPVIAGLIPRRRGISKRSHARDVVHDVLVAAAQAMLEITFLAHQTWLMVDAIVRTLARLSITRKHLLEWQTAAQVKASRDLDLRGFYRQMAGSLGLAVAAGVLAVALDPGVAWIAAPFVALWLAAPWIARRISLPGTTSEVTELSDQDVRALRRVARRTWLFFETFVGTNEHGLPPDNYQEDPQPLVAHRTSPTNIGMYLLSTVSARDFGWIGTVDMIERLEATLATVGRLETFHGHLYNWYDTQTLQRLEPEYVSTVDSGNLAGHLLAMSSACRLLVDQPLALRAAAAGIGDALALAREAAGKNNGSGIAWPDALDEHDPHDAPTTIADWDARLQRVSSNAAAITGHVHTAPGASEQSADDLTTWIEAAQATAESHRRDLSLVGSAGDLSAQLTLADLADRTGVGQSCQVSVATLIRRLLALADESERLVAAMDFRFLFDPVRKLFSIGYLVREGALDQSYYDLLASEARLTSFIAIAKGDVEADHWFRLGRALTPVGRGSALISWSGSMFEYLMPSLVMRAPAGSLLEQTSRRVVARQIRYAAGFDVPWGISESGYNARDLSQIYQYSAFGVPGLALKRGLSEDLVVAPYASALAAIVDPQATVRNFAHLAAAGADGHFGFYEALDYTPRRLPAGASVAVVKSYMAHHQGMTLVALGNVVNDDSMVERFHAEPLVEATELLLQERMPRNALVSRPRAEEVKSEADVRDAVPPILRRFTSPHDTIPRTHLLSNGNYSVMLTTAGSGYSRWRHLAITRWREDVTCDQWGSFVYVRDTSTGAVWSPGYQPAGRDADSYEVSYSEDQANYTRRDGAITTGLTVMVSAEDDAEIRRISLTNLGARARELELTSYQELVLAPQAADVAHPAFQNLFIETEYHAGTGALLATRRPRSSDDERVWAAHIVMVEDHADGVVQYETDRARFLDRGRSVRSAASVMDGRPLSNTVGAVLDPIFSLRRRVIVGPGETVHVIFATAVADSREQVIDLADKYRTPATFERARVLAWTHAQVQLHHLGIDAAEAQLYQRLANRILYSDPSLRPPQNVLAGNRLGPPGLWPHGISGDLPIVVVRVDELDDVDIVRQLLRAHEYWRLKGLDVDLVIVNEHGASYADELHGSLESIVRASQSALGHQSHPSHGGVYVLRGERLTAEGRTLLLTAARAVLLSRHGRLVDQVIRLERPRTSTPIRPPAAAPAAPPTIVDTRRPQLPQLEFFNGLGGFDSDGREYVVVLGPGQSTPAPWLNVIANPSFGFQVSESGAGYTWAGNSRENQLTPWSNDPVSDPPGESLYVRDDDTGELWSPTAQPIRCATSTYVARHGPGYSRFQHLHNGIQLDLVQFVQLDTPVKVSVLTVENHSGRPRRLSLTAYAEWVLATSRGASAPWIVTESDPETRALLATNPWNTEFGSRVAFLDMGGRQASWTADRTEFLGRNGTAARPAGLALGHQLQQAAGAGMDPCAALQTSIALAAGERAEIVVVLGQADSRDAAIDLVRDARSADHAATLREITQMWDDVQDSIQVRTPDRALDIMLNGWLVYQTLACRLWSRAALYQAGGAYGFRDQLQDVIALIVPQRQLAREHILRAAARQFVEGDVQHWWHPPTGRGVRTRISDDRLWLPYTVDRYLAVTADHGVLDETIPYLEGPPLQPGQHDAYFEPEQSSRSGTLYEHCAAAIDCSLAVGAHGLPLIGGGDWNDGMNRVGEKGQGESVWLGWFLYRALAALVPIAESRADAAHAESWRAHMERLRAALEEHGWDGDWYRRAFFDDGTPLGSASNVECRIDSIAQSWSILSGAAEPSRAERAMAAVDQYLIRRGDGLVLLFTPPFDHTDLDPGYIKGYVPGVRENGGQYTHGAIWSVLAFAALGDGNRAGELLSILNPVNHASTTAGMHRYKVEPYVMAGDVYAEPPHTGRGGWTWYTGAAGWMYQAGIEWILGFHLRGTQLDLEPCIPATWPGFEIRFRYHSATYEIAVENPHAVSRGIARAELDGELLANTASVPLRDDGATHTLRVVLGPTTHSA